MSLSSINLLTWSKSLSQRAAGYVLVAFMLQVIAVGFCVPMASAHVESMTKHQTSEMTHCMNAAKQQDMSHSSMNKAADHVCSHCDLPDLNVALDKQIQTLDADSVLLLFVTLLPSVQTIAVVAFQNLSPPLRTSLFTFDLNQRFRV